MAIFEHKFFARYGSVAVPLRCGGIFKNDFIANLLIYRCKSFENWLAFGKVTDKYLVFYFYLFIYIMKPPLVASETASRG